MNAESITNEELELFRARGDDALDGLVAALPRGAVPAMLGALFRTEGLPENDPRFEPLLRALSPIAMENPALVAAGQRLFQLYGPEILLVLGCYGLPAAYAAANGVEAIHRARRLEDDTKRRLCETAQMLINVMQPGALAPDGVGTRSSLKVRLMHALIRHHVRNVETPPWSSAFGEPINQEDLAGTLLTFSILVLDGLRKIGVELSQEEERGYLEVWHHVGALVGVPARLSPRRVEAAAALAVQIGQRQFRPSEAGRHLMRELVQVTNSLFPVPGYGLSLMHFFLDQSVFGVNLAQLLDLPPANWTRALVRARSVQKRALLYLLNRVPGAKNRRRVFAGFFAQHLILLQRPDKQSPFEVPPALLASWRLSAPALPASQR